MQWGFTEKRNESAIVTLSEALTVFLSQTFKSWKGYFVDSVNVELCLLSGQRCCAKGKVLLYRNVARHTAQSNLPGQLRSYQTRLEKSRAQGCKDKEILNNSEFESASGDWMLACSVIFTQFNLTPTYMPLFKQRWYGCINQILSHHISPTQILTLISRCCYTSLWTCHKTILQLISALYLGGKHATSAPLVESGTWSTASPIRYNDDHCTSLAPYLPWIPRGLAPR